MTNRSGASELPWYRDGLSFACTGCGHCCCIEGYVWVSRREIPEIAEYLGLTEEAFAGRYLRRVGRRHSLVEKGGGKQKHDCVFWEGGCQVYPVRPTQCRTYPFWKENLESPEAWREVEEECPGAAGGGRIYSLAEIEELRQGRGETPSGPRGQGRRCTG